MSDRTLRLLLIDPDPIFCLGLRVALETISHLQIVANVSTDALALQVLGEITASDPNQIDLIILELGDGISADSQQMGLEFCRQIKQLYPYIPILLFSSISKQELLLSAKNIGVNGYCHKGISISGLLPIIQELANGGYYWLIKTETIDSPSPNLPFAKLRNRVYLSGISQINTTLASVTTQLKIPGLTLLDQAILAGHRRELLAARWLVNKLLAAPRARETIRLSQTQPLQNTFLGGAINDSKLQQIPSVLPPLFNPKTLQSTLFASCINKLQFCLHNLTEIPLEIDIFREEKKRELLYLVLQKVSNQLDELSSAEVEIKQLPDLKKKILNNLWESVVVDFYGKYSRISVGDTDLEIVNFLLKNSAGVETEILNKIPLTEELFSYLLWQTNLYIDNTSHPAGSEPANLQASLILENLLIQIANGVVQPLLNFLADVEIIKQNFYDRQLISTREIERFRNNLSWKYRLNNYINEPQAIFESRYELFIFATRGIAKISIYAPRTQELAQLSGLPLGVTLLLEFRDAIAPQIKSLLGLVGSGIVFILTKIIGRGLGLIGRGILQGIGSVSLSEKSFKRNIEKQNNNSKFP
jgi:DNA-binding NarL/FixJ family response regulator